MCWILHTVSTAKQIPAASPPPDSLPYKADYVTMKCVLVPTRGTHPNVVLAQSLPKAIVLRIDRHYHMMDSLGNWVLPLQVHPSGKVHDTLRQLLYVKRMQCGWTHDDLEKKILLLIQLLIPSDVQCTVPNIHRCWTCLSHMQFILNVTCSLLPSEVTWGIWLWILLMKSV